MTAPNPRRRLSSQAVHVGMMSMLSLVVAACSSDTTPGAAGVQSPYVAPTSPTSEPTETEDPDDEDDETTAYCVRSPKGGVPEEEPEKGYRVVDDDLCDDDELGEDSTPPTYSPSSSRISYFWYYGGTYRSGYVSGGSLNAPSYSTITTRSGKTARGGFGGGGSRSGG